MLLTEAAKIHSTLLMGRPTIANHLRRTKIVAVRLSPSEFTHLKRLAARLDMPIGKLVRESVATFVANARTVFARK